MSVFLRICLFTGSVLTCAYIARKLKKSQMQVTDTVFWLGMAALFIILSAFPGLANFVSELMGFQATVNFVFLVMIFMLLLRCFLLSIKVSQLEDKLRNLVEEIAVRENMNNTK